MDARLALPVLAGAVLAATAVAVAAARPRRPQTWFFAGFALLWGVEIALFALSPHVAWGRAAFAVALAATSVETLFLVHFAASVARAGARAVTAALVLIGLVGVGLASAPSWFMDGAGFTPLSSAVVVLPNFAAYYFAIQVLVTSYLREDMPARRRELGLMASAISVYAGYSTGFFLLNYGQALATAPSSSAALFFTLFAGGTAFLGSVAWKAFARSGSGRAPDARRSDRALAMATFLPLVIGVVRALAPSLPVPFGLGNVVAALLIAYGVLHREVYQLDLTLKQVVRNATPFAAFALLAVVAGAIVRETIPDASLVGVPLFLVAGLAVGGTGAAVAVPLRHRAADAVFPYVTDNEGYRRARGLEVYQAALEQAVAKGNEDDPILPILRKRFQISELDHASLLAAARYARDDAASGPGPAAPPPLSRYRRDRLLHEGPLAKVWLATDTQLDRDVVLKEFLVPGDPTPKAEARAASGLASPYVVTVHDLVQEGERQVLVLEYVDGGSLQARLDRDGRLPRDAALAVAADVLRGLAVLHAKGLVHQDVKPANVLLTSDGRAKVSDFGIAERGAAASAAAGGTLGAGPGAGTPHYMSPEQEEGRAVDARADVYAVGALLYRMLAGRFYLDFGNAGEYHVRRMIVEEAPALPLKGEPDALNALLAAALAKDPAARFPSADAMREAMAAMHP